MPVNQIEAVLFGLALGDALGYPVEFMPLEAIRRKYTASCIQAIPFPVQYSDDTQMTLAFAEGVLDAGIHAEVGNLFTKWLNSPDNNRVPGTTCINGVKRFQSGISWYESRILESKNCGSATRVAPLGYLYQQRRRSIARSSDGNQPYYPSTSHRRCNFSSCCLPR